jgi:hypothetical protein
MIKFSCPSCNKVYQAPENAAGKLGKCAQCGMQMTIPHPNQPIQAPPPLAPEPVYHQAADDGYDDLDRDDGPRRRRRSSGDAGDGTTPLVLGILSLVVCGPLGIAAIITGNNVLRDNPDNGSARAGVVCGWIATGLMAVGLLIGIFIVGIAAVSTLGSNANGTFDFVATKVSSNNGGR